MQPAHADQQLELVVVYPSDNRMSQAERSKMVQLMKEWESVRDAAATVILAEGLMGSLHRSILTGLMMLAPAHRKHEHFWLLYGELT